MEACWTETDPGREANNGCPKRIEVSGPLVAYRDGFVEELPGQGYTTYGAMNQVWLMADLSRWLRSRPSGWAT